MELHTEWLAGTAIVIANFLVLLLMTIGGQVETEELESWNGKLKRKAESGKLKAEAESGKGRHYLSAHAHGVVQQWTGLYLHRSP